MRTKHVFAVGFMLFAMFFGAGNLIFPPGLGFNSGEFFLLAIIGFVLTGVGLPLLGVIAASISKEGYIESLKAVHPAFSVVLLVAIYLTIGPFFAIPRTATTAYEMGIVPFLNQPGNWAPLLIFTIVYFLIIFALSYSPNSLVDTIGKFLTPVLLVTMLLLIVTAILSYINNPINPTDVAFTESSPFTIGFTEGYLTMDAIAAIAFSMLVLNSIRSLGVTSRKELLFGTIKSASLAAVLLAAIYIALGWLGTRVNLGGAEIGDQNLGTFILTFIADDTYGTFGAVLLGIIVLLACMTTAAGLIVSVSQYFNSILPKIPYRVFVVIFTLISFGLANQGLNTVIETSVPVLSILYPIAMTSVFLLIITYFIPSPRLSMQLPVALVVIVSILAVIHRSEWMNLSFIEFLPLFSNQFEWIPLLIIGYIAGYIIASGKEKVKYT